jgi:hypothetical protein
MVVTVILSQGLERSDHALRLLMSTRIPQQEEFISVVRYRDKQLLNRWLPLVPLEYIGEAWVASCNPKVDNDEAIGVMHLVLNAMMLRAKCDNGIYQTYIRKLHVVEGDHRRMIAELIRRDSGLFYPTMRRVCKIGNLDLFEEMLILYPEMYHERIGWLKRSVKYRHTHMYPTLLRKMGVRLVASEIYNVVGLLSQCDRDHFREWAEKRCAPPKINVWRMLWIALVWIMKLL